MSARAGVFVKVVKRILLANPGRSGTVVWLLKCGHARTGFKSTKSQRMWCRICTATAAQQAAKKPATYTQAQLTAVAKAIRVAKGMTNYTADELRAAPKKRKTRMATNNMTIMGAKPMAAAQAQLEEDRKKLIKKFPALAEVIPPAEPLVVS